MASNVGMPAQLRVLHRPEHVEHVAPLVLHPLAAGQLEHRRHQPEHVLVAPAVLRDLLAQVRMPRQQSVVDDKRDLGRQVVRPARDGVTQARISALEDGLREEDRIPERDAEVALERHDGSGLVFHIPGRIRQRPNFSPPGLKRPGLQSPPGSPTEPWTFRSGETVPSTILRHLTRSRRRGGTARPPRRPAAESRPLRAGPPVRRRGPRPRARATARQP